MAISNGTQKVVSPVKLAHVVLRTSPEKFAEMVSFYKTFLGAHAVIENETLSFMTYDDEHHRIAIAALPDLKSKDKTTSGLEHISFTFKDINDLLSGYTQRKELDPDGNNLETQIDSFDTPEEATASMQTEDFKVNPFSVDFEPDDYIEKLKPSVPVKQLLERPKMGPRSLDTVPII